MNENVEGNEIYIIVSGAGGGSNGEDPNGTYEYYGIKDNRPKYRMTSEDVGSGYFYIIRAYEQYWALAQTDNADITIITSSFYRAEDDSQTPDLSTNWEIGARGISPIPSFMAEKRSKFHKRLLQKVYIEPAYD